MTEGKLCFSNNQQTRSVFVDAMHQTGSMILIFGWQLPKVINQCIHQSPTVIVMPRVNNHTSWLIYNQQIIVFIDDIQWDVLRINFSISRCSWK